MAPRRPGSSHLRSSTCRSMSSRARVQASGGAEPHPRGAAGLHEFGGHYQSPLRETAGIIEVLSFIAVASRTRDIAAMASGSLAAGCAASICSAVSHSQASPYRLPGQLGPAAFISASRCSEPGPHLVGVAVPEVGEDLESSL